MRESRHGRSIKILTIAAALLGSTCLTTAQGASVQPGTPAPQTPAPATPDPSLPQAKDLFAKHVQAMGGEAKAAQVTSRILDSVVKVDPPGNVGRITAYQRRPDQLLVILEQPGILTLELGYDGKVGWTRSLGSPVQIAQGDDLAGMQQTAVFHGDMEYKTIFSSMQTLSKEAFGGKQCYKVKVVDAGGRESFRYFDSESGLIIGRAQSLRTPRGIEEQVTSIAEYRDFEGLLYPSLQTEQRPGVTITTQLRSVAVNPADMRTLEAPPHVIEALKNAPAPAPATAPAPAPKP